MAHDEQMNFISSVRQLYSNKFSNTRVLEIGSLDINGSVRKFFNNCQYIGIDVGPGRGVDIVCEGQNFNEKDGTFDVIISCECFEHNPYWVETFQNMIRLCKSGGLIIMTCATEGRPEHGTLRSEPDSSPLTVKKGWSYYKNLTEQDFTNTFNLNDWFNNFQFSVNNQSYDLYFVGERK